MFPECANVDMSKSPRAYLGRIFRRPVDKVGIDCPQFEVVSFTDHEFVICMVNLNRIHRQGS